MHRVQSPELQSLLERVQEHENVVDSDSDDDERRYEGEDAESLVLEEAVEEVGQGEG